MISRPGRVLTCGSHVVSDCHKPLLFGSSLSLDLLEKPRKWRRMAPSLFSRQIGAVPKHLDSGHALQVDPEVGLVRENISHIRSCMSTSLMRCCVHSDSEAVKPCCAADSPLALCSQRWYVRRHSRFSATTTFRMWSLQARTRKSTGVRTGVRSISRDILVGRCLCQSSLVSLLCGPRRKALLLTFRVHASPTNKPRCGAQNTYNSCPCASDGDDPGKGGYQLNTRPIITNT